MSKSKYKIEYGGETTTLLSWTEDMSCYSFSLPAGKNGACPLAVYGENSICGTCYAQINRYNMPNVLKAQYIRYGWLKHHLKTSQGRDLLYDTFLEAIQGSVQNGHFRFFDSGDFFHPDSIWLFYRVCKNLPSINFWFPTRCWYVKSRQWNVPLRSLARLKNVSVRPSALYINEIPPQIPHLSAGTTVIDDVANYVEGVNVCPKTNRGGTCSENYCRACWSKDQAVSYLVHGWQGASKVANALGELNQAKRAEYQRVYITVKEKEHEGR